MDNRHDLMETLPLGIYYGMRKLRKWIGLAVGLAFSLGIARLLSSLLCGISANDPVTFLALPAILAAGGLFASHLPARRAMKVDPLLALRYE